MTTGRIAYRPVWLCLALLAACRMPHVLPAPEVPGPAAAPPELSALAVTDGGTMYPAFTPGVYHYGARCGAAGDDRAAPYVAVTAQARQPGARLTLLRADPADNAVATGSLATGVAVAAGHDIAIEASNAAGTATYVVHCLPADLPDIRIVSKRPGVSDGLLLVSAFCCGHDHAAVVDNNGVPRFHHRGGPNFRRHADGPLLDGRRVRYSDAVEKRIRLLDDDFDPIRTVSTVAPLPHPDFHDFLFTEEGNYLFISYPVTVRDLSAFTNDRGKAYSTAQRVRDSVIQEVTPDGVEVFRWNSWDHLKLADCHFRGTTVSYSHLNSLQLVDGDIVAGFRNCAQVVRIDRSSGSGAIEWQLGGTAPPRRATTTYLAIVDDPAGELCALHQPTLTAAGTVVVFDNGNLCHGARKNAPAYTGVVEYDVSDGARAVFRREYRRPAGHGHSSQAGGVTVLDNGHWLITWGLTVDATVPAEQLVTISEVDPATGTALLEMSSAASTYRVYRERESDLRIPLRLP
ncbi:MAG: aryl-sulfate sulfotransferase [Spirochaetaceae bacterium]|nr:aryl-sulfate sulfotransferase [Spirochaetaceae bacterium]